MDEYLLYTEYYSFSTWGLEFLVKDEDGNIKDVMKPTLDYLTKDDARQICINAYSYVQKYGVDYCYEKFTRTRKKIDKSLYLENIDYLEMLSYVYDMLLKAGYRPYKEKSKSTYTNTSNNLNINPEESSIINDSTPEERKLAIAKRSPYWGKKIDTVFYDPSEGKIQTTHYIPASTYFDSSGELIGNSKNLKWVWSFVISFFTVIGIILYLMFKKPNTHAIKEC